MSHSARSYLDASDRVAEFFSANLDDTGKLVCDGVENDPCFYYKLPTLLLLCGKHIQANRVINYIDKHFICKDGDVRASESTKTMNQALSEYYTYINGWIAMGAHRFGRLDVSAKLTGYLEKFRLKSLRGFATKEPFEGDNGVTDMLTNAHLGLLSLYLSNLDMAKGAADLLCDFIEKQQNNDEMYHRMDSNGGLITVFPEDAGPFYVVKAKEPNQLYFFIGYASVFLAKMFSVTRNSLYLDNAKNVLDFCLRCDNTIYEFHFAHKVALAASIVANITKEVKYITLATRIADFLLTLQDSGSGLFLNDAAPSDKYDQSVEIGIWMREIYTNLNSM